MKNNASTLQTWDKVAEAYQSKFMYMDMYNDTYDHFCDLLEKPCARIFEIGCGPGNITKYILSRRPDFVIEAIDASPNIIKLAKENNPSADFKVMDCREIDKLVDKFDAIICGFCMPYLSKQECSKLIKDCARLLNDDGIFYFSVIEDDYKRSAYETSSDGKHSMFVYYHQEGYLLEFLKQDNFELVSLERKSYPKTEAISSINLIMIAKKKK